MRYRRLTSISSQFQWVLYILQTPLRSMQLQSLYIWWQERLQSSMELVVSAKLVHVKFHGIPWNCSCHRNWRTPGSMEFHGTASVNEIGAPKVPCHGIPWNCSCQRNWRTLSSMEFHGIFFCCSMEPLVSSILWVLNLYWIPWNLSLQILVKMISTFAVWINFRKLRSTLYRFVSLFPQLMFYYQHLHYTICISGITH